jgi:hypothetical protein
MQKLYFQEMKWKLFFSLVFTFIAFTIIGTQTHEYGHYAAAKYLGMQPSLHYQSVEFADDSNSNELNQLIIKYEKEIENKVEFPLRKRYEILVKLSNKNYFYSTLWGPLQTMITGTIGFILLIIYRKKYFTASALSWNKWLLIFVSLFWLRQVSGFIVTFLVMIFTGRKEFKGDEFHLSYHLGLRNFTILFFTAIVGLIICCTVIFKFVPATQRKIFIAAGLVGGVIGYILWMHILGPILLP